MGCCEAPRDLFGSTRDLLAGLSACSSSDLCRNVGLDPREATCPNRNWVRPDSTSTVRILKNTGGQTHWTETLTGTRSESRIQIISEKTKGYRHRDGKTPTPGPWPMKETDASEGQEAASQPYPHWSNNLNFCQRSDESGFLDTHSGFPDNLAFDPRQTENEFASKKITEPLGGHLASPK